MRSKSADLEETPTVKEAKAALEAARRAERQKAEAAERQQREFEREMKELRKNAEAVAAGIAESVDDAVRWAEQHPPRPMPSQRGACRAVLRGETPYATAAAGEEGLGKLFAVIEAARGRLFYFGNPLGDSFLMEGDPGILALDEQENRAYRAFMRRCRVIAGED
jgi:hypothetical protein